MGFLRNARGLFGIWTQDNNDATLDGVNSVSVNLLTFQSCRSTGTGFARHGANLRNGELRLAPNDIAVIVTQLNDSERRATG
eukprot:COSAG01_NODE_6247_length_3771_cov_379.905229_3_plen_82_part_00